LAAVDEVVLKKIGVDVRAVGLDKPSNWKLDIKENQDYYWFYDEWQRKYQMPKSGGHYYDIVEFPLAKEDFENYQWPDPMDPNRFSGLVEKAQAFQEKTGAALVAPEYLANQGFSKWVMMLAAEPSRVEKFLDQLLEFKMKFWDAYLSKVGDKIDVACEADDLGTQRGTWISKDMYRKYIKPRQSKLYSFIKKKADVKVFLHSCGSVYDFIPDLIETGVDILNPVQVSAANMDTKLLKKEFGSDLVFWGGGINTQGVLPYGTTKEVEEDVKRRIDDLAPGGGFIFATVHNIQSDVPPENIVAMLETLERYGKY